MIAAERSPRISARPVRHPVRVIRAIAAVLSIVLSLSSWEAAAASGSIVPLLESLLTTQAGEAPDARQASHELAIQKFYAARDFQPLWVDETGPTEQAARLVEALGEADAEGLSPADYDHARLQAALMLRPSAGAMAELEYHLSRALLDYAHDLGSGRVAPREVDRELYIDPRPFSADAALAAAAMSPDIRAFFSGYSPSTANYQRLKSALATYRGLAARGAWVSVPPGETLRPGDRSPRVAAVRERLMATDEALAASTDETLFDTALDEAVRRFQDRHGLDVDGAVGAKTLAALNVPASRRVEQILLNLERRRWMPNDLGERYVFVNLADFELKLVEGPKTILDSRVVIGDNFHRTPVFSGDMTYLVLNPYWNVPPSIAGKELLPKIRRNVSYLASNSFRLFSGWGADAGEVDPSSVDWSQVSARSFPYKIRQEAGDANALGRVKFMFPNQFDVYLHDTPSRGLFSRSVRNFSHGCIRVGKPIELATMLLRHQPEWSQERIEAAIASGEQQIVRLASPVKVHITYLTAWVNKDGSVYFHDDVYGRDARLERALHRRNRETAL